MAILGLIAATSPAKAEKDYSPSGMFQQLEAALSASDVCPDSRLAEWKSSSLPANRKEIDACKFRALVEQFGDACRTTIYPVTTDAALSVLKAAEKLQEPLTQVSLIPDCELTSGRFVPTAYAHPYPCITAEETVDPDMAKMLQENEWGFGQVVEIDGITIRSRCGDIDNLARFDLTSGYLPDDIIRSLREALK